MNSGENKKCIIYQMSNMEHHPGMSFNPSCFLILVRAAPLTNNKVPCSLYIERDI